MIFTFNYIEQEYCKLIDAGYEFITCEEYFLRKKNTQLLNKIIVNRVDIDFSLKKTEILVDIFNKLNIKASFFIRLHAPEYNPFSFESYRIVKKIILSGHELGYHSEIIDQSEIWKEPAIDCLLRDIDIIERMFQIRLKGIASHGGLTTFNNLSFWYSNKAIDFGLLYEAYDKESSFNLFHESFYISDSEWKNWKCYNNGVLVNGDKRSPSDHISDNHKLIYLLIHPDTYYFNHIYE
jgi:hypothetical protein